MSDDGETEGGKLTLPIGVFLHVEHAVYIAIGALLALTAVVALVGAGASALDGIADWRGGTTIPVTIERLLFVLMIAEILHTVRISIRSGSLTCEPFLVVGLIASIRRVLVITLTSSEGAREHAASIATESLFRSSMIELCVLAMLIVVMVFSIYLLKRGAPPLPGVGARGTGSQGAGMRGAQPGTGPLPDPRPVRRVPHPEGAALMQD